VIELYTAPTPNGWKISILLEELKVDYKTTAINLSVGEQKQPSFLELNPNGRIPVIKDLENNLLVFESGAIMMYLAEKHQRFLSKNTSIKYQQLQWLMFQVGNVGPMMGQANVFYRYFQKKISIVIDRYQSEVNRLFSVLDQHLQDKEYLAGDYSIADISNWCWVHTAKWSGVDLEKHKNLKAWTEKIASRPAVIKGKKIPFEIDSSLIKKTGQKLI
jgi:GST-like protein